MKVNREKLFSKKFPAGSRTYCFEVRVSVDGTSYLIIKELRAGNKEGQIMVFKEHLRAFYKGLVQADKFLNKAGLKKSKFDEVRAIYPKAYSSWKNEDDQKLKDLYIKGVTTKQMVIVFQRQPSAIRSRIRKLGLLK